MKKVYILINHLQLQDGVARTAVGLANELAKREDLEVTIQSLFRFDKQMRSSVAKEVKLKPFLGFYFRGLAKLMALIPDRILYRLLVREKYDVEIGFCMTLPIQIIAAGDNRKCLRYAWIHGYDDGLTLRSSYEKMDKVISVSQCNARRFAEETDGKISVCCCHNLVDDHRVRAMGCQPIALPESDAVTFVAVGRLEYGKGILRLIEACGRLKQEGYRFRLWLVGDGEQREELEHCAAKLDLQDEVLFLGAQSNPYAYMAKSDVLVCASYSEGYSTVCVEAIMLNVPVLSTNVSGAQEIVADAQAGLVVGMEDADVYAGLKRILDDPAQIAQWKKTLRTTKVVFSYENRARELAEALDF